MVGSLWVTYRIRSASFTLYTRMTDRVLDNWMAFSSKTSAEWTWWGTIGPTWRWPLVVGAFRDTNLCQCPEYSSILLLANCLFCHTGIFYLRATFFIELFRIFRDLQWVTFHGWSNANVTEGHYESRARGNVPATKNDKTFNFRPVWVTETTCGQDQTRQRYTVLCKSR